MSQPITPESRYLRSMATRIAQAYAAQPQARAALLAGSSALGISDRRSDIDLSIYYEALPDDAQFQAIRASLGADERFWMMGDPAEGGFAEAFRLEGVECQVGHITIAAWERDMERVLSELDVANPLQKALDGTRYGLALAGDEYILRWKERVQAFPDALAEAMVRYYLAFFPAWFYRERFLEQQSLLWLQQVLVENVQHVLGVLAGLNRRYYSTFQFKHMHDFIGQLSIAPPGLAERIEQLFSLPAPQAINALEQLVSETVNLVDTHMPQIDTGRIRARFGARQPTWELPEDVRLLAD